MVLSRYYLEFDFIDANPSKSNEIVSNVSISLEIFCSANRFPIINDVSWNFLKALKILAEN